MFLDTCVFKAARRVDVYGSWEDRVDEKGEFVARRVPLVRKNYNDAIGDDDQRAECDRVEEVARRIAAGHARAVTSHLALIEFMKLPKTIPASSGMLHGADVDYVEAPVPLFYAPTDPKENFRAPLEAIENARFLEIRRQVGAFQGERPVRLNQLIDAFLLWTAETAGCAYFLTVEKKLPKSPFASNTLRCVRPSALLEALDGGAATGA